MSESLIPLILIGAGGHAKVLLSLMLDLGRPILGVCDPALLRSGIETWRDIRVLGDDSALDSFDPVSVKLVNGIGYVPGSSTRHTLHQMLIRRGFKFAILVHERAWVDSSCLIGEGSQIMAGAVLQADASVGVSCIVNTGATVDHDCVIEDHVHIAPGATLCGGVRIGSGAFIGAGATLIQGVRVGAGAVVGAGTVVLKNISEKELFLGHQSRDATRVRF